MASVSWNGATADWNTPGGWSGGKVPTSADDATLAGAGTYTVSVISSDAAKTLTLNNKNATLEIGDAQGLTPGTLTLSGAFTDTAGTVILDADGTIVGGTLSSATGKGFNWKGGTLSGVTYSGTLILGVGANGGQTLFIRDSLTASAISDAAGPDPVQGQGSTLGFDDNFTLTSSTITLGNGSAKSILEQNDTAASAGTLTFASTVTINVSGSAEITSSSGNPGDAIVNQGVINANGLLQIDPANFANSGTINVGKLTTDIESAQFTNTGSITVGTATQTAATLQIGETNGGIAMSSVGKISLAAKGIVDLNVTTATAGLSGIANTSGGTLSLDCKIDNSGAILSFGTGTSLGIAILTGEIDGGTIVDNGAVNSKGVAIPGLTINGGTFGGTVTYDGTLSLTTAISSLEVMGGLITHGDIAGKNPGVINLTGDLFTLQLDDTQTLDNATLTIGNATDQSTLIQQDVAGTAGTLTLGPNLTIVHAAPLNGKGVPQPSTAEITSAAGAGGTVVNKGTVTAADAGGVFLIDPDNFQNFGAINVSNGDSVSLQPNSSFINEAAGSIVVSGARSNVSLGGPSFQNSGSVTIGSGGSLLLGSDAIGLATLGSVSNSGGTIVFQTTFDLGGGTLDVGTGTAFGSTLLDGGTIENGTIADAGAGMSFNGTNGVGKLQNVTYDGTLNLASGSSFLDADHLQVNNAAGNGAGTINLTGDGSELAFTGTQTFGGPSAFGTTIDIGSNTQVDGASALMQFGAGTLTLGSNVNVDHVGAFVELGAVNNATTDTIDNDGTINATLAGATFLIDGHNFINDGTIAIANGDTVDAESQNSFIGTTFSNAADGTITVASGSALLTGTNTKTSTAFSWSNATISVASGGTLTSGVGFANSGTLSLSGGTVTVPSIADSGRISGFGTVTAAVANSGTIEAAGGSLTVSGAITGTGTVQIDNGATLGFVSSVAAGTSVFFGTASGTLALSTPGSFQGTLAGALAGDLIDLLNTAVNGLTFDSSQIVLTNNGTTVTTVALSGIASDLDYSFASDGSTGTDIIMSADQTPVTTAPKKATTIARQVLALTGVSVFDGDAVLADETIMVSVFDQSGHLSANAAGGGSVTHVTNKRLQISGTLDQVNAALATLTYTDPSTGSADSITDTVTVKSDDGRGGRSKKLIAVTVDQIPPATTVPGDQAVTVGQTKPIMGIHVSDSDAVSASETMTVKLHDGHGHLSATASGAATVTGNGMLTLTVSGTLTDVNTTLHSFAYRSVVPGADTISVTTTDGRGGIDHESINVLVQSIGGFSALSGIEGGMLGLISDHDPHQELGISHG